MLIRIPVFNPTGDPVRVSATLLHRQGQVVRALDALGATCETFNDFTLPLAALAPDDYQLELRAVGQHGAAVERLVLVSGG